MRDLDNVKTVIEQLKSLAENEFEIHRIEILERDLIEGLPQVEIIDDKCQKFDGLLFKLDRGGHFTTSTRNSIHRAVWMYYHGAIPEGDYVIHHIDFDKGNNDISNLQLVTKSEHQHIHKPNGKPKEKEFICDECGKKYIAFDCGQVSHFCSKSCRDKNKNKRITKVLICPQCGKEFETRRFNKTRFCSRECAQIYNHALAVENKTCPVCGKIFECYKYRNQECCSAECGNKWKYIKRRELHVCEDCGKEFIRYTKTKKYCGSCASKHRSAGQSKSTKLQKKYEQMRETRTCPVCGKEFVCRRHEIKECCSRRCRSQLRSMKEAAARLKQINKMTKKSNDNDKNTIQISLWEE